MLFVQQNNYHNHCFPAMHRPFMPFLCGPRFMMPWHGHHNNFSAGLGFGIGMGAIGLANKILDIFI